MAANIASEYPDAPTALDIASNLENASQSCASTEPDLFDNNYSHSIGGSSSQNACSVDCLLMLNDEPFIKSHPVYDDVLATDPSVIQTPNWFSQEYLSDDETHALQQYFQDQERSAYLPSPASNQTRSLLGSNNEATVSQTEKRFSTASLRVLNRWLSSHVDRPYPTTGDVEIMQRQSGLSKKQILTWFANARRRKKLGTSASPPENMSPSNTAPRQIPHIRPPTPVVQQLNPFERWRNSPPEHEPASVPAIARALLGASSDFDESTGNTLESEQSHSIASSATGAETSHSSHSSHASGYSHSSRGSSRSFTFTRKERKKKRRAFDPTKSNHNEALVKICHPYQCTFCTETFKTKHTWQRHEKSLHLSLEQWACSPDGPSAINGQSELVCVYCGLLDPQEAHFDIHNHSSCQERLKEERLFFRKDHLSQHLRLVHNSQFMKWPMEGWNFTHDQVRSRCGFCEIEMATWTERASHLAQHFKEGSTMADWKGGWGFDKATLDMVENAIQPYLIDYERNSPLPFTTQQGTPYSPTGAFELIELEIEYFSTNYTQVNHCEPPPHILHFEACCIIFGAELLCQHCASHEPSWLRDLLLSPEGISKKAQMRPMKSAARSRFTALKIHGKDNIFEECKLEASLHQHVRKLQELDMEPDDSELQRQACVIINDMSGSSEVFSKLLVNMVNSSTLWLAPFRSRAGLTSVTSHPPLPITIPLPDQGPSLSLGVIEGGVSAIEGQPISPNIELTAPTHSSNELGYNFTGEVKRGLTNNDSNSYRGLWRGLSRFVLSTMSPLNPNCHIPTDDELQYQARWLMFDSDDPWNQTLADNPDWLREFKREIGLLKSD